MNAINMRRWVVFGIGCLALIVVVFLRAAPVASQGSLNKTQFGYRVIEVPPDTRSIQAALDEYGHAGWELVAFEMGELQAPRLIFKKGTASTL
jgi:hypothetical protein